MRRKKDAGPEARVAALERRVSELEERLRVLEGREALIPEVRERCCSDELIGCLDDCTVDVKELRKRARDVRSPSRGH